MRRPGLQRPLGLGGGTEALRGGSWAAHRAQQPRLCFSHPQPSQCVHSTHHELEDGHRQDPTWVTGEGALPAREVVPVLLLGPVLEQVLDWKPGEQMQS